MSKVPPMTTFALSPSSLLGYNNSPMDFVGSRLRRPSPTSSTSRCVDSPSVLRLATSSSEEGDDGTADISLQFRLATAEDIPTCYEIESSSYPSDEAATLESLKYRQKDATDYFLLCCTKDGTEEEILLGFCCATRCEEFTEESMSPSNHNADGRLLAIHSVVIRDDYRRRGIATRLLKSYLHHIHEINYIPYMPTNHDDDGKAEADATPKKSPIDSIVLLAKSDLLGFYVQCGFTVNRPSPIIHGKDLWYELEYKMIRTLPTAEEESWFVKTEQFKKPYPVVKPYLHQHTQWIQSLRTTKSKVYCVTSGYRVDSEGKPGGGGLMIFAAKNYQEALQLVQQDPLIVNDCVTWELNGWLSQVGNIQLR